MTFIGNKQRPCKANKTGDTKPQLSRNDRKMSNSIVNSEDIDHQPAFARKNINHLHYPEIHSLPTQIVIRTAKAMIRMRACAV